VSVSMLKCVIEYWTEECKMAKKKKKFKMVIISSLGSNSSYTVESVEGVRYGRD
jgi:hypothetical protein